MKKSIRLIFALLFTLITSFFVGMAISAVTEIPPGYIIPVLFVSSLIPMTPKGVLRAGINPEIWQNFIAENLFRGMEFVRNAFNADQFVVGGRIVHIPQAGNKPTGKRNRVNLPATVSRRSDTDVTYALDEFTTDPTLISNAELLELSYDKLASVLGDHVNYLRQLIGDWMPYNWAPATNIIRTTGGNVAAHLDNATGNRKLITIADYRKAKFEMNKQGVSSENRFSLIDSNSLDQLISSLSITDAKDFSRIYDPITGSIGKIEGFNIIERPQVIRYTNASTPVVKLPDAAGAATDNATTLFWQKDAVEKAEGTIEMFEKLKDPTFYGDIYSALVRLGGRIRRADEVGVISLVQASA